MASWVWTSKQDYLLNWDFISFELGLLKNFGLFAVLEFRIETMRMRSAVDYQKEGLAVLSYSCSRALNHFVYFELFVLCLEFAWFARNHDLTICEKVAQAKYSHLATQGFC